MLRSNCNHTFVCWEVTYSVDSLIFEIREAARRNRGLLPALLGRTRIECAKFRRFPSISQSIGMNLLFITSGWMRKSSDYSARFPKGYLSKMPLARAYAESLASARPVPQHIQDSFSLFSGLGWFSKSCPVANQESQ